ncbi:MAG: pentapeptide repeat-containing protein [Planctomycetes bacterium]|nr:pentapeptide repeat-containing protein [Planctomycetota bacterium]
MEKAEKIKESWKERKTKIKHKWVAPFIFPEWLCERVSYFLGRWAFLDILGHAGRLTILVAVIFYFAEAGNRRKVRHYQAWQLIYAAQGKVNSSGRIEALQDLNKDGISLAGLDISQTNLQKIYLENADLSDANLAGADLTNANLAKANLEAAKLSKANLRRANLARANFHNAYLSGSNFYDANLAGAVLVRASIVRAYLIDANLIGADLTNANLTGADLRRANLAGANLDGELGEANLTEANLSKANLAGAILTRTDLTGANLKEADLKKIRFWKIIKSIELANIFGVKNPPDGFIEWAKKHGAVSIEDDVAWKRLRKRKNLELRLKRKQEKVR